MMNTESNNSTLNEELKVGHLKEILHQFVAKHIITDDPCPEYSWLDRQSGNLEQSSGTVPYGVAVLSS